MPSRKKSASASCWRTSSQDGLPLGAQFDRMEALAGRITTLSGAVVSPPTGVEYLRSAVAHTTSAMLDQLQLLQANVQSLDVSAQAALEHVQAAQNGEIP